LNLSGVGEVYKLKIEWLKLGLRKKAARFE
jgi:hypothetical protein